MTLAWWHTGKHACMKIWKTFAQSVLAPWWHFLYPSNQFHLKPGSFPMVTSHLLILHHSYPKLKATLKELMDMDDLAPRFMTHAKDCEFLFEYAIPTVNNTHSNLHTGYF
jgi:hypothetical protein